ncbi:MAG: hypothetical protein KAT06_13015 [Gammaproteobacteria bacterium]|nr:hypothetical protein [Gammaproteobacteria bacterium]
MKHIVISALLAVFVIGCGASDPKTPSIKVNPKTAIKIKFNIPYAKKARVEPRVIKTECDLPNKLSKYIHAYSVGEGIGVIRKNKVRRKSKGKVLLVYITEAVSVRVGLGGHAKYTVIKGTLYKNGRKQAGFTAARRSGGGAFGFVKSSCDVLGRTVKILGSDVSNWLLHPVNGAHLGDRV